MEILRAGPHASAYARAFVAADQCMSQCVHLSPRRSKGLHVSVQAYPFGWSTARISPDAQACLAIGDQHNLLLAAADRHRQIVLLAAWLDLSLLVPRDTRVLH